MSNRALERRLSRLNQGVNQGVVGGQFAMANFNPREYAEDEQDRNRINLAARLLEIRAETVASGALAGAASEALAAAEIIYPELPPEEIPAGTEVSNG